MKKIFCFLLFILPGCNVYQKDVNSINLNFSDDLTYEEYKIKLDKYTNLNEYPNLNE